MPMFNRTATAKWNGTGKEGKGWVSTETKSLDSAYNFAFRFGDEKGTNPEELIAAAHASCFNMKLAFTLDAAGITAEELNTTAHLTLDKAPGDWTITKIHLVTTAKIPGADDAKFQECVATAKAGCPVSRALNAEITAEASLV